MLFPSITFFFLRLFLSFFQQFVPFSFFILYSSFFSQLAMYILAQFIPDDPHDTQLKCFAVQVPWPPSSGTSCDILNSVAT